MRVFYFMVKVLKIKLLLGYSLLIENDVNMIFFEREI